jgi:hypothetical protein
MSKTMRKMKIILLLIQCALFSSYTFAQCVEIDFLEQLFDDSLEKQDQLLNNKGFSFRKFLIVEEDAMDYVNTKFDHFIAVHRTEDDYVDRVQYRLKGDFECYEEIKSELSSALGGLKKDFEWESSNTLFSCYKSNSFGVILEEWHLEEASTIFYTIEIHSLASYYKELGFDEDYFASLRDSLTPGENGLDYGQTAEEYSNRAQIKQEAIDFLNSKALEWSPPDWKYAHNTSTRRLNISLEENGDLSYLYFKVKRDEGPFYPGGWFFTKVYLSEIQRFSIKSYNDGDRRLNIHTKKDGIETYATDNNFDITASVTKMSSLYSNYGGWSDDNIYLSGDESRNNRMIKALTFLAQEYGAVITKSNF